LGTLRIGFIGHIAQHKSIHLLLQAFAALRTETQPIELHIYGGLDASLAYVAQLRQLAGDDRRGAFHGRFENTRVAEILANLNVVVVPSLWYENSPLAIMQAQAAGTPVVTAALGGMAELVCDGVDGLLFQPASAADLARQLQHLIDDADLLPRLRSGVQPPRAIDDEMRQLITIYHSLRAPVAKIFHDTVERS
jgi:glycosyltransferase involved in cell wall biosynthesis